MHEVYAVPEYGRKWKMSKASSYRAAHSGAWPVVKIGSRLYVPRKAGDELLRTGRLPGAAAPEAKASQGR